MSQRVGILLVAAFVTCFVGSCAVGTLKLINASGSAAQDLATQLKDDAPPPVVDVQPLPDDSSPSVVDSTPPPDDTAPVAAFEAPVLGMGQLAVYRLEKARVDPWLALQRAAKDTGFSVYKETAPDDAALPYLVLREFALVDYAPLEGSFLENGHGLTKVQQQKLPSSKLPVSVVDFYLPLETEKFLQLSRLMATFAQATGGILWDEETREYFVLDSWKAERVSSWEQGLPMAMKQFTVPVTDDAESGLSSLRTAGLKHFGFAELELVDVPTHEVERAISLLNAAAQTILEGDLDPSPGTLVIDLGAIRHVAQWKNLDGVADKNAAKKTELKLVPGDSEKVPTLRLVPGGQGAPSERMQTALLELFGKSKSAPLE